MLSRQIKRTCGVDEHHIPTHNYPQNHATDDDCIKTRADNHLETFTHARTLTPPCQPPPTSTPFTQSSWKSIAEERMCVCVCVYQLRDELCVQSLNKSVLSISLYIESKSNVSTLSPTKMSCFSIVSFRCRRRRHMDEQNLGAIANRNTHCMYMVSGCCNSVFWSQLLCV